MFNALGGFSVSRVIRSFPAFAGTIITKTSEDKYMIHEDRCVDSLTEATFLHVAEVIFLFMQSFYLSYKKKTQILTKRHFILHPEKYCCIIFLKMK